MALVLALVVTGLTRCTVPRQLELTAAESPAVVEVINRTDYSWTLVFTREALPGPVVAVPARQTVRVNIAPGDYRIAQRVEDATAEAAPLAQTITATLAEGQRYRWPLLTLLSNVPAQP